MSEAQIPIGFALKLGVNQPPRIIQILPTATSSESSKLLRNLFLRSPRSSFGTYFESIGITKKLGLGHGCKCVSRLIELGLNHLVRWVGETRGNLVRGYGGRVILVIFVSVQPSSTTLFRVPFPLPTSQGRRDSQLRTRPQREIRMLRNATPRTWRPLRQTYLLRKECQGCSETRRPSRPAPRIQSSGAIVTSQPWILLTGGYARWGAECLGTLSRRGHGVAYR